ncbi:MAG: sigma-70 family RNA polymerase sigma factor [Thermoanaerobaculia bacterium]|nr:sigma-70 family RNA polymerase sigma factor [Thermoanaerobaculia bacterium]
MSAPDVTTLLEASRRGDAAAGDALFALLYAELKRLARAQLGRGRRENFLDTTTLVHEAYLRLAPPGHLAADSRAGLLNLAARVMRNVLIDMVRRRQALKRGGELRISWPEGFEPKAAVGADPVDLLALDAALKELEQESPRLAELVDLRFFGGLELDEIAALLGVTDRTLRRDWRRARAFLWTRLEGAGNA